MSTSRTFIAAKELAALLGDERLRLFDCRFELSNPDAGREAYSRGHLPRAGYADLNRDLSAPVTAATGRHPLPAPDRFEATLRDWGVNDDSAVVAYDDRAGMYAARLWWMMRWLGYDDVRVLDGGYARWRELGLPVVTDLPPRYARGNFVARPRSSMIVSAQDVLAATRDGTARVLDARGAERFRGDVEPIDAVAGHVPGALNHPYTLSLGPDGRVRSAPELRASFAASLPGAEPARAIAMCGSGVTACHLLLALEHAGLTGGRLYPGSWSEWIRDPARPVAKGPN